MDGKKEGPPPDRRPASRQPHRPYASMNWIRFIGFLRCLAAQQYLSPLSGRPW